MKLIRPLFLSIFLLAVATASNAADKLDEALARLDALRPASIDGLATIDLKPFAPAAMAVEQVAVDLTLTKDARAQAVLGRVERLLTAKAQLDHGMEELFALRSGFVDFNPSDKQRDAIRNYLRLTSLWIDLCGRLRYLEYDVFNTAAADLAVQPAAREKLIDLLTKYRSSVGAIVMSELLFDPPPGGPPRSQPISPTLRGKVLELIAVTGETECLAALAEFVSQPGTPPALMIQAAETIRRIGLPQAPRPGQDPTLPQPAITAAQLKSHLGKLKAGLNSELRPRYEELTTWLDERANKGLIEPSYQWGSEELHAGDWLLMRNPSPYNLFTDLSPGLFTHVGVVGLEKGTDGIARMVIVDLPERGDHMPATNVDTFVQRSRHYLFLRHPNADVARAMGEAAVSLIGNETQFDLNFRTDRVLELKDQPLKGKKVHTYCAGLLLLCALQTSSPREDFFPLTEFASSGQTAPNMAQLGLSFGKDFVSPTGGLFSTKLQIVGRREPTYDPRREVEESIFDHFAKQLAAKKLQTSPDLYQSLRLKMAEAAKHNPLLAQAMAKAAGVNAEIDLAAAAKAAAVVETLDEIAFGASAEFLKAQDAIREAPADRRAQRMLTPAQRQSMQTYRQRHPRQFELWQQGRISRRQLRVELVQYYVNQGTGQLDRRFFNGPANPKKIN